MNMIRQPNIWSCTIASLAMVLDTTCEQMISEIGHDGSEVWFPNDVRPNRGFSLQELIDVGISHGVALVPIDGCPVMGDSKGENIREILPQYEARLNVHMVGNPGLIVGYYAPDKCHMVAWDGCLVRDPMDGRIYSFDDTGISKIMVDTFYRVFRIKEKR